MTLTELRDKANAKLTVFWTVLVAKQDAYFAKYGKYFQLLVSPETPVVDGVDSDFILRHPSDEKYLVDVVFPWSDKIPFQIEVTEWTGSSKGFEAKVTVELPNGDVYKRERKRTRVTSEDRENLVSYTIDDTDWFKYDPVTL